MAKKDVKNANGVRAKKAAEHEKKNKERANDQATVKAAYVSGNGELILQDLRAKIALWQKLNTQIAQDGVGARPTGFKLEDGSQEVENVYFTPEQRVTYLDRNHGMQSILDYIDRQMEIKSPEQKPAGGKKRVKTV